MKNYSAARKLVKLYESITIKKIKETAKKVDNIFHANKIAAILIGKGSYQTCILCQAVGVHSYDYTYKCTNCIYDRKLGCVNDENLKTYNAMSDAETSKELQLAFRNRAKHIRSIFEKDRINFKTLKPIKNV